LRRIGTNPGVFRPTFITLVMVACLGIFSTAELVRAQSSPWQSVGTGDCPGRDLSSSTGPTPDPAKCDAAFAGFTAVCWSGACTYKNLPTASCTGGANPGRMYRCVPGSPPPTGRSGKNVPAGTGSLYVSNPTSRTTGAPIPNAAAQGSPPARGSTPATAVDLGTTWTVVEFNSWFGTWTRRAGTNVFDAVWKNSKDQVLKDTIELLSLEGNKVSLYRAGNKQRYTGTLAADGRHITGTASLYGPGQTWTATIHTSNDFESILGEWLIYRGGPVGTSDENKPVVSGMLVLWDENGSYRGRLGFEGRQTWEDLPDLTFDKGVLTFTRAPTERRPVPQSYRAVISGDKLAGTITQDSRTQKWWGTKMKRAAPSVP
jgi:hypothetical protein